MSWHFFGAGEFWSVFKMNRPYRSFECGLLQNLQRKIRNTIYRKCINCFWVNPYPVSVWSLITHNFNLGSGIALWFFKRCYFIAVVIVVVVEFSLFESNFLCFVLCVAAVVVFKFKFKFFPISYSLGVCVYFITQNH